MGNTVTVELKNDNALNFLHDLEKRDIIHIIKKDVPEQIKLSDRFRGILTKEQGESLRAHVKSIREEWDRDIF